MFREMRRSERALTQEQCREILKRNTSGVLALSGDDGYPYAVPLSYVYDDGVIYFHSARTGHKIDALSKSNKASFCIIDKDEVVPEKYTTAYQSVIAFGKVHFLDDDEIIKAALMLAEKYCPDGSTQQHMQTIDAALTKQKMCMFALKTEHLSGKEGIELVRRRQADAQKKQ